MFRLLPGVFAPGITYSPGVGSQGRPSLDSGHSLYCYAMGRIYKIVLQPKCFSLRSKMKLKTNAGSYCTICTISFYDRKRLSKSGYWSLQWWAVWEGLYFILTSLYCLDVIERTTFIIQDCMPFIVKGK